MEERIINNSFANEKINEAAKEAKSFAKEKLIEPVQAAAQRVGSAVKNTSDSAIGIVADNMESLGKRISEKGNGLSSFPETTHAVGERIQGAAQVLRNKGVEGIVDDVRSTISKHPLTSVACVLAAFVVLPRMIRR